MAHAHFDTSPSTLLPELRAAVDGYFARTGLSRHANAEMVAKTVLLLGGLAAVWATLTWRLVPMAIAIPLTVLLGLLLAAIGFNVGHDAIHGAYSTKPWVNRLLGHSFGLVGANAYTWAQAHNVVHHTYTNIMGVDHDLEPGPWLVLHPGQKAMWIHRFQHLYALFLYGFTSLVWVFKKDYQQVLSKDPRTGVRPPLVEFFKVLAWKLVHVGLFVGAPMLAGRWAWWQVLVGYLVAQVVAGVTIATVFQLAHVVEQTVYVAADEPEPHGWAEHQLRTTANFAMDNAWVRFFCGGLTHQVEHHLFSRICHVHYRALAPLVREVAHRHGIPYLANDTFFSALGSHLRQMARLGRPQTLEFSALGRPIPQR